MILTKKQEMFCKEYIIDFNATRAAVASGYSVKTANRIGSENLLKLDIQQYIQQLMQNREKRTEITSDSVLRDIHLAREIALGIKPHKMIIKDNIGDGITQHVEQELHKTDLTAFVKLTELQMRHLGMFDDRLKVEGEFNLTAFVKKIHDERS